MVDQWEIVDTVTGGVGVYMANTARGNPRDLVRAFRKVAKELGCNQSEQRFQEVLVAIGRYKSVKETSKRPKSARKVAPQR
jgi:glycine/D-amino acid oxidase-like deaminating enzyme